MNKNKFFKALLSLLAVAVLGVSCQENPNDPGKPSVSSADVVAFLKRIDSATSLTATANSLGSGNTYAVTLTVNGTKNAEEIKGEIVSALEENKNNIKGITAASISYNKFITGPFDEETSAIEYTITLEPANKTTHSIGSYGKVKVVVTPAASDAKWKKFDIESTDFLNAIKTALAGLTINSVKVVAETVSDINNVTINATGAANTIIIDIDASKTITDGANLQDEAEAALDNKFQNIQTELRLLGINITAQDFGAYSGTSTVTLSTGATTAVEYALYNVKPQRNDFGSSYAAPLANIKITIKAGKAWTAKD